MWLIVETAGLVCGSLTYFIVFFVQLGFIRIGVWEGMQAGNWWDYAHFCIFQYHVALIYFSHFRCMTTEPGVIPKNYEELDIKLMSK